MLTDRGLDRLTDLIRHRMTECRNGDVVAFLESVDQLAGDHGDRAVRQALAMSRQVSELRRRGAGVRPSGDQAAFQRRARTICPKRRADLPEVSRRATTGSRRAAHYGG